MEPFSRSSAHTNTLYYYMYVCVTTNEKIKYSPVTYFIKKKEMTHIFFNTFLNGFHIDIFPFYERKEKNLAKIWQNMPKIAMM